MADNTFMYREIKNAVKSQIANHLNGLGENVDVYRAPYQNIAVYPAIALELDSRRKPKVGVGVKELELDMFVWVYADILDIEDAEDECYRLLEIVEDALEQDKTLGGASHYLTIDDSADFGTVESGEGFLQGAKLLVTIKKRFK